MHTYQVQVPEEQKNAFEKMIKQLGLKANAKDNTEFSNLYIQLQNIIEQRSQANISTLKDARISLQKIRSKYDL